MSRLKDARWRNQIWENRPSAMDGAEAVAWAITELIVAIKESVEILRQAIAEADARVIDE